MMWQQVDRYRETIRSSKNGERYVAGLAFMSFAFSVGTWHMWLEHKVGLYAWMLCSITTVGLSLVAPNRGTVSALLVFAGSYLSLARAWQWLHGEMPLYVPLLWVLGTLGIVSLAPKPRMTFMAALVVWVLLSIKAVVLDREPRAIYITVIASLIILAILLTAHDSDG
jgi:hypothetical protein